MEQGDLIAIRSDRLSLTLAKPGSSIYGGTRYDHAGFVCSILLDGQHQFAAPELPKGAPGDTSGGLGLNSMYMLTGDEESAQVGKPYVRMGAGYLKRPDDKWSFMRLDYEYEPFPVSYEQKDDEVVFTTVAKELNGFGYRQIKRVRIRDNKVMIETTLLSTGEKRMEIKEYNHNFLCLGTYPTDEKTRLELAALQDLGQRVDSGSDPMRFDGHTVTWPSQPQNWFMCFEDHPESQNDKPYSWRLSREDSSLSVSESDSFRPHKAVIWGKSHVVSPEMYHCFTLETGDSHTWTRTWTFEG